MIDSLREYISSLGVDMKKNLVDEELLLVAFTHKSYSADAPEKGILFNERLEFLGDSILGAVVAASLYRLYPNIPESQLTLSKIYLVKEKTLAAVARKIDLGKHLRLGNGEERSGGKNKDAVLSDALEALFGYVYINFGRKAVEKLIQKYIVKELDILSITPGKSFKSQLQEFVQKKNEGELPVYKNIELIKESTGNVTLYGAEVYVHKIFIALGKGKSKKRAQEDGAEKAILKLKKK